MREKVVFQCKIENILISHFNLKIGKNLVLERTLKDANLKEVLPFKLSTLRLP